MVRVVTTFCAVLLELEASLELALVLSRVVVDCFAVDALEMDHVILRHRGSSFTKVV